MDEILNFLEKHYKNTDLTKYKINIHPDLFEKIIPEDATVEDKYFYKKNGSIVVDLVRDFRPIRFYRGTLTNILLYINKKD